MSGFTANAPDSRLLQGVVIVDLSRVLAGPFSTMILSQLGARIIKVEIPGTGDDSRAFGPFANGKSLYFSSINFNKESIALNLKHPDDRAIFERLLEKADVLVENYRPGTMEKLGYGWAILHDRFPRLIYSAASGFGDTGPYSKLAAYDVVVQGLGGLMSLTGYPGGRPVRVGVSVGDEVAGLYLTIGTIAALYRRTVTGRGEKIDVAMLDCQVQFLEDAITAYAKTGQVPHPLGTRHPSIAPFQAFKAKDAFIIIAAANDHLYRLMSKAMQRPDLASDARFATNALRNKNVDALETAMEESLAAKTVAEWIMIFEQAGVPAAPINNIAQIAADPQVKFRNMVVSVKDPIAGEISVAGNPIKVYGATENLNYAPPPELDQQRAEILAFLEQRHHG